jgi:hypothetical protein
MTRRALLLSLTLIAACSADLGALAGIATRDANFVASGRLTASTKLGAPTNEHGFLVGLAVESRSEARVGSGPAAIGGRCGFELYGEVGTPMRSTFFERGDYYLGAALAVPLYFGTSRQVVDLNRAMAIANWRTEIVPMLRMRLHHDHDRDGRGSGTFVPDVSAGMVFRFRAFSDLF